MSTVVAVAVFIVLASHMAWYINLPFVLFVTVLLLGETVSKKRYVRYLAFCYLLFVDVAAPYEASRKDGWDWVVWVDLGVLLAATLVAAVFVLFDQENAGSTRPAPPATVQADRPVRAPRRRLNGIAALHRQAERAASRRR